MSTRLIREGDRSQEVADVQARLRALGFEIDDEAGAFGASTRHAVRAFQQRRSILADGIVGPHTWDELVEASWRLGDRVLYLKHPPMRGDDVSSLQTQLNALGFDAGRADGIFGPNTARGVRAFQKEYGVTEDGIFGTRSHGALQGLRIDRPGTAAGLREELQSRDGRGMQGTLVVLDPGHGSSDTGDRGPGGSSEADVCWDIGTRAATKLAERGARVRFTRTETESPNASARAARANRMNGDLFVSIHLNSNDETTAEGASTYYFGTSRAGETLAECVLHELLGLGLRDCRSHARSYTILKETRMPAILVEPAFITNPDDEKRLDDPEFRTDVAAAIVAGIARFYETST
ncbi:MAG TPA: N-acetylmuramoyl-L-alanine amidase [Actinomycetota bacterium]|jgi:N-acetylmuramoyl-L-alanine amidase